MTKEEIRRGKKNEELGICAFCRTSPYSSNEEGIERLAKLMENGYATAYYQFGGYCAQGIDGMQQDMAKANELWLKAGELGCAEAYCNVGNAYDTGAGVERIEKKAKHLYELAAMKGDVMARHNLGAMEGQAGNYQRQFKHYVIAAKAGYTPSLDVVKKGFMGGVVTKDEYASVLRAYHERQTEMKSVARDAALKIDVQRRT